MRRALPALLAVLLLTPAAASAHTLTYGKARTAAQKKADAFAGMPTSIESLQRTSRHRYVARAEWDYVDPTGCKGCVYDEATGELRDGPKTVQCSVTVIVRYRTAHAHRPVAAVDEHTCF